MSKDREFEGYRRYVEELVALEDDALREARATSKREKLPPINVSASEGKLLQVLARSINAQRILEIGTLGGYSAIWLARALPPAGQLVTLEINPHHAEVARRNFVRAGLSDRIEVRVGPALDSLHRMSAERAPLFDLVFIDADKEAYVNYLEAALPLLRRGGLLLADNTLPEAVLNDSDNSRTKPYNAAAAANSSLTSIIIPVFRDRGLDGLMISVKI